MEGPSLVIAKEELEFLIGKKLTSIDGARKDDVLPLKGKTLRDIRSHGKHLLLVFPDTTVRIHFLMFGSYRLNERRESKEKLQLCFSRTEVNFYACAIKILEGHPDIHYDWSADVMADQWNPAKARRKLKKSPDRNIGDALLDQEIFAGVGNIIKNEVLYRVRVHPESVVGKLPPATLTAIIREARNYSFDFYEWKKEFVLRKNWLVYKKKRCLRCALPVLQAHTGLTPRRSFFCEGCQVLYA